MRGHDVLRVQDLDPRLPDDEILSRASADRRLVITMDKDFGELVYLSKQSHAGVLLLRLEEARIGAKLAVVEEIFTNHAADLSGRFSVYQRGRLRIR